MKLSWENKLLLELQETDTNTTIYDDVFSTSWLFIDNYADVSVILTLQETSGKNTIVVTLINHYTGEQRDNFRITKQDLKYFFDCIGLLDFFVDNTPANKRIKYSFVEPTKLPLHRKNTNLDLNESSVVCTATFTVTTENPKIVIQNSINDLPTGWHNRLMGMQVLNEQLDTYFPSVYTASSTHDYGSYLLDCGIGSVRVTPENTPDGWVLIFDVNQYIHYDDLFHPMYGMLDEPTGQHTYRRICLSGDVLLRLLGKTLKLPVLNVSTFYNTDGCVCTPAKEKKFNDKVLAKIQKLMTKTINSGKSKRTLMDIEFKEAKRKGNPFATLETIKENVRKDHDGYVQRQTLSKQLIQEKKHG